MTIENGCIRTVVIFIPFSHNVLRKQMSVTHFKYDTFLKCRPFKQRSYGTLCISWRLVFPSFVMQRSYIVTMVITYFTYTSYIHGNVIQFGCLHKNTYLRAAKSYWKLLYVKERQTDRLGSFLAASIVSKNHTYTQNATLF